MSADTIIDLYERHALAWAGDRARQSGMFEQGWLDRFAAMVPEGGRILDIGCGTAKPIAAYLISRGFRVHGIDSSPSMISLARRDFPDNDWTIADMRALALGQRFDGLLAWDSFFHLAFDDQRRMFPIFRDHANTGAPLLFTSGPGHGVAMGELRGEPLYHASLDPTEYRALLAANSFSVVAERMRDPDCGGHSVWLARHAERR